VSVSAWLFEIFGLPINTHYIRIGHVEKSVLPVRLGMLATIDVWLVSQQKG